MRKVLFIDVDGTLCGKQNKPCASAIQAIKKAREKGHEVYICTGRSKGEIDEQIWQIGFDGMIGANGSYIEDHGKVILHQHLSLNEVKDIVKWLNSRNLEFYLEANSGLYPSKNYCQQVTELAEKSHLDLEGIHHFFACMSACDTYERDDINKISYLIHTQEDLELTKQQFPHLKNGFWSANGSLMHGDIGVNGIDKKQGIIALCEYLHVQKEDTIAFGDEIVDIPMFEATGFSVCMGSGNEECKKIADYVTSSPDEDGLYQAFVYLKLIDHE